MTRYQFTRLLSELIVGIIVAFFICLALEMVRAMPEDAVKPVSWCIAFSMIIYAKINGRRLQ